MTDGLNEILQESKKNKFSAIWNSLSEADVVAVWENVARFVEKNMLQQKGVAIPGLGTFTFSQVKLDVGNNKFLLLQRPVFVLQEKFVQTHALQQNRHNTVPGGLPVIPLNMSQLSLEGPYDRDTVESCVREVVGALSRSIASRRRVDFPFAGIGRLQVDDLKAKMKFYKTFVNTMDGSGTLVESLQGRPGTADSVVSERCGSRMSRSNTSLGFSRKLKGLDDDEMVGQSVLLPAINEEDEEKARDQTDHDHMTQEPEVWSTFAREGSPCGCEANEVNDYVYPTDEFDQMEWHKNPERPASASGRVPLTMPQASVMSFTDDIIPSKGDARAACHHHRHAVSPQQLTTRRTNCAGMTQLDENLPPVSPDLFQPSDPADGGVVSFRRDKIPSPPGTASSCGHSNSGQELCYLCHQRARRNVAISFAEERRRKEKEHDELLRQFQEAKATAENIKEQEKLLARRHELQKQSAFNLGVAEANAMKKLAKDEFQPSFVFPKRLLTPPQFLIQERYQKQLEDQIAAKEAAEKKQKMDEEFLGRLEQVTLAEELAAEKAKRLKEKADNREEYRRALSAQLRMKPEPIPGCVSPSSEPYFGKNDVDDEKMAERRRKAHELYREQVAAVDQRKRDEILKRIEEQRREEEMLRRVKNDCLTDAAGRYDSLLRSRRSLESDWLKAAEAKKARDLDQRLHDKAGGALVHEQCDKYKRCRQCKRRMNNTGETNVWCETRFVPGTRIMV